MLQVLNDGHTKTPRLFNRAEIQLAMDFKACMDMLEKQGFGHDARRIFALGVKMGAETIATLREKPECMECYAPAPASGNVAEHFGQSVAAYLDAAQSVIDAN